MPLARCLRPAWWGFSANRLCWRFAPALAHLPEQSWPVGGWEQWAAYRLGLYATVAASPWDGRHLHGGLAVAVSLAACGQSTEAERVVRRWLRLPGALRLRFKLADDLAPFMPLLACELADMDGAPAALRIALLLHVGESKRAAELLAAALRQGKVQPQLHLFASNVWGGGPTERLSRLNRFLEGYGLAPVALRDGAMPPGAANLVGRAAARPAAHGPLVSVLMTAYDSAGRVGAALDGLLRQTYRDLEIVVVDDASDDDTAAVVKGVAARDPRVRYYRLPCNAGTYVAKTVGARMARGEFLVCHDSDDWSHPERIERQVKPLLEDRRLVATTSQWVRIQDDGTYYARPVHPLPRLNPASPMFRRKVVEERMGLWDLVRTGADSEFHARLKVVFGRRAVRRLIMPLAFGAHRPDSLMNASDTGYDATGVSPQRLAYWEAWGHWHIAELRAGRTPFMPLPPGRAPFSGAVAAIAVPQETIDSCLHAFGTLKRH